MHRTAQRTIYSSSYAYFTRLTSRGLAARAAVRLSPWLRPAASGLLFLWPGRVEQPGQLGRELLDGSGSPPSCGSNTGSIILSITAMRRRRRCDWYRSSLQA
jgi:hypothetical protein